MKKIIIFCLIIFTYSAQINAKDFSGVYVGLWCELSPKCKDKIEKNLIQPVHSIFSERRNKTFIYIDQIEKDNFKILISDPFFEIENIVFQENRFVGQIRVTGRGKYKIEGSIEENLLNFEITSNPEMPNQKKFLYGSKLIPKGSSFLTESLTKSLKEIKNLEKEFYDLEKEKNNLEKEKNNYLLFIYVLIVFSIIILVGLIIYIIKKK